MSSRNYEVIGDAVPQEPKAIEKPETEEKKEDKKEDKE